MLKFVFISNILITTRVICTKTWWFCAEHAEKNVIWYMNLILIPKFNIYTELRWLTLLLQFDVNHIIILAPPIVCVSLSDWVNPSLTLIAKFIYNRTPDQRYAFGNAHPLLCIVFCKTVDNVSSTFEKQIYIFVPKNKRLMDENRTNLVAFFSVSD